MLCVDCHLRAVCCLRARKISVTIYALIKTVKTLEKQSNCSGRIMLVTTRKRTLWGKILSEKSLHNCFPHKQNDDDNDAASTNTDAHEARRNKPQQERRLDRTMISGHICFVTKIGCPCFQVIMPPPNKGSLGFST